MNFILEAVLKSVNMKTKDVKMLFLTVFSAGFQSFSYLNIATFTIIVVVDTKLWNINSFS
jgi:hypothetical protein